MNIYVKVQHVFAKRDPIRTKNYLISIYVTMPSTAYTDLTHFTVWLNQISLSQIKEHETRFGWKLFERCSRSYQDVRVHSRLMGITVRTNLGFPAENMDVFVRLNSSDVKTHAHWRSSLYSKIIIASQIHPP